MHRPVDRAVFPGMQGGPLMHTIAAKAACFKIAATEAFRDYQRQVRAERGYPRRDAAGEEPQRPHRRHGHPSAPARPARTDWTGKAAEERLDEVKLTVNRNTVPFDEQPPTVASGVRIGTPAATMRGSTRTTSARSARSSRTRSEASRTSVRWRAKRSALRQASSLRRVPRLHVVRHRVSQVVHVDHPLVRHKLSFLRDKRTVDR
jgi:hypothetical protein